MAAPGWPFSFDTGIKVTSAELATPAHVMRSLLWVVLSSSLHVKALEFAAFVVRERENERIRRLNLINPRVSKITVMHAVCTWRCWTLPLLWFERERMQLVYEIISLNTILGNHLYSVNLHEIIRHSMLTFFISYQSRNFAWYFLRFSTSESKNIAKL